MGLIRTLAVGAALAYGINYITKKRPSDGKSVVDDIKEKAPEWWNKAKPYMEKSNIMEKARPVVDQIRNQFGKTSNTAGTAGTNM